MQEPECWWPCKYTMNIIYTCKYFSVVPRFWAPAEEFDIFLLFSPACGQTLTVLCTVPIWTFCQCYHCSNWAVCLRVEIIDVKPFVLHIHSQYPLGIRDDLKLNGFQKGQNKAALNALWFVNCVFLLSKVIALHGSYFGQIWNVGSFCLRSGLVLPLALYAVSRMTSIPKMKIVHTRQTNPPCHVFHDTPSLSNILPQN